MFALAVNAVNAVNPVKPVNAVNPFNYVLFYKENVEKLN